MADSLTAICEPVVQKMWDPQRLTTLWAFTACYRDSFSLSFYKPKMYYASPNFLAQIDRNSSEEIHNTMVKARGYLQVMFYQPGTKPAK
jgi:hypothetical protein